MKLGFSTNVFNNPESIVAIVNQISASYQFVEIELENDIRKLFEKDIHAGLRYQRSFSQDDTRQSITA